MSSQYQIDANRRNAQLSTGPVTPQGKAAVSQNAFKHGIRSERYIDIESDPTEYYALCARLVALHQPQDEIEENYVERMAITYHKLCFLEAMEEKLADDYEDKGLHAIWQQQTRLERSYDRARAQLRQIQQDRKAEAGTQTKAAEVKQAAKEIVTEALQVVSVLRQGEAALKLAPKPLADEDDAELFPPTS